jgi:hypothetical protein
MDEPGRTFIQASATRDVGEVVDAIDGRIDGTRTTWSVVLNVSPASVV